jgi:hypothetical protein
VTLLVKELMPITFDCPAARIVEKMGGTAAVAKRLKLALKSVYSWQRQIERKGTGGHIPMPRANELLKWAREEGIDLTEAEFFWCNFNTS